MPCSDSLQVDGGAGLEDPENEFPGHFVAPTAWQAVGGAAAMHRPADISGGSNSSMANTTQHIWRSRRSLLTARRPLLADAASAVLQINIGGMVFSTSVAILRRAPFFESLLKYSQQGHFGTTTDPSGRLFVDRPGDLFAYILEYLRCGRWMLCGNVQDAAFVDALQAEAAFYGLDSQNGKLPMHEVSEYIIVWQFHDDKMVYLDCLEQTIRDDPDQGLFRLCKHSGGLPLDQLTSARRFKATTQSMQAVLSYFERRGFALQHVLESSLVTHTMSADGHLRSGLAVQYILCRQVNGGRCWPGF
mmetsp:Transcript_107091/g.212591  ORF Transcript_107091/g.212591 Transcript_107091/m.212591 type:complete len:303 (+) Transcript_107091:1157-2065(+)